MDQLNFHHLRYFWAVAHEGNLTRAARRLGVSQSAVSIQVQQLEASLGHPLFERRGKQLVLTEAGRIALDHADAIFATGSELIGTLRQHGAARRALRIGALATLSRNFQLGFLRPVLGDEQVEIIVHSGSVRDLLRSLEAHRLDVVLANHVPSRDAATPWVSHALAEQRVSLVGHPRRATPKRSLRELLNREPLVLPALETSIRSGFDALAARLEVRPTVAAEVDDMAMLRLLAREDIGVAVVPTIVVRDELERGDLVELTSLPGLKETFYAITLSRRFPNPLLRALITDRAEIALD